MSIRIMSLVFDSTLPATQKLVMLSLADHANDDGRSIYPSVARLCRKTSLTDRSVRRTLSKLRAAKVIEIARYSNQHQPTEYAICVSKLLKFVRPDTESGVARPAPESARPDSRSVRPDTESGKPSGIHHDPSGGEPLPSERQKHNPLLIAIELAFSIDLNGDGRMVTNGLKRHGATPEKVPAFSKWWWANDWRGKKGEPPTAKQIVQLWPQAFKVKSTGLKGVRSD